MIQATFLEPYLRNLFANLAAGQCLSVGWGGRQDEGPNYSYHTHPDGTLVRIIWAATPSAQNLADMQTAINAYVEGSSGMTLDDKLALLKQMEKTIAAIVEVLVAAYGANPPAGTPAWAKTQLAAVHQFIKNQGG